MVGRETIARSMQHIQPIWSKSSTEARSRAVKLYKSWFREIPHIIDDYNLPLTVNQCRAKLRTEFSKQKHLSDIRQIDTLVMKHQRELKDICSLQVNRSHILNYWTNESDDIPQRTQFLAKFLVGQN